MNSVLSAQGRAPGRRPVFDLNFRDECARIGRYQPLQRFSQNPIFNFAQDDALAMAMCHNGTATRSRGYHPSFFDLPGNKYTIPLSDWFWSPLHIATSRGDNELIVLLFMHGGDHVNDLSRGCCASPAIVHGNDLNTEHFPSACKLKPLTPLECALYAGHISTARLLIAHGAKS